MRLLRGLCSSSARPSASMSGGTYMAKRPRRPFLSPYQPPTGIVRRAGPRLDRALRSRLLLVGAAEEHPVAVLPQHRVEVVERAQLVAERRLADDADERRRVGLLVPVHLVLRRPRRGLQNPRRFLRARRPAASRDHGTGATTRRMDTIKRCAIRNVLFDLDGTLIDSGAIILASFKHATRTVLSREIPDAELARTRRRLEHPRADARDRRRCRPTSWCASTASTTSRCTTSWRPSRASSTSSPSSSVKGRRLGDRDREAPTDGRARVRTYSRSSATSTSSSPRT